MRRSRIASSARTRVDRVAHLLEVALGAGAPAPPPARRAGRGASRRAPMFSSETDRLGDHVGRRDAAQFRLVGRAQLLLARLRAARGGCRLLPAPSLGCARLRSHRHLLGIGRLRLAHGRREDLLARRARLDHPPLALRAVALGKRRLDRRARRAPAPSTRAAARSPRAPGTPRRARGRSAARRGRSGSRATCSPRSAAARGPSNGTPSSTSRTACAMHATISAGERLGLLRGRLRVADAHLDGAEAEVRPHRPPHLGELDDRAGAHAGTRCTRGRPPSRRTRRGRRSAGSSW